jgi:hypothetical protein
LVVLCSCRWHFGSIDALADSDTSTADASDGMVSARAIYASTQTQLYRIDPTSLVETLVMPLCTNVGGFQVSDFAVSSSGDVVVADLASTAFHRADATGNCTFVTNLMVRLYAMTYVPPGVLGPTEVLLGAGDDDGLYRVDPTTGVMQLVGSLGGQVGDLVWTGTQLLLTRQTGATFSLFVIDPSTGATTATVGDTSFDKVYGLVWSNGALFGFTNMNGTLELDPATGAPIRQRPTAALWYGAGTGP